MANSELGLPGLRPLGRWNPAMVQYIEVNTGTNHFRFEPVVLNNSGQLATGIIAAGSGIVGTVLGFLDMDQSGLPNNLNDLTQNAFLDATSSRARAAVLIDEDQLYTMESDTGGTAIGSENSAGQTVTWTYHGSGTGSTVTGISLALLDRSTIGTGTGGILQLVRAYREFMNPDGTLNDVTANFEKWVVKPYKSPYGVIAAAPTDRPS